MCIIAYLPAGQVITREEHDQMWSSNKDGLGIIAFKKGAVHSVKKALVADVGWNEYSKLSEDKSMNIVLHYRFGTHGTKGIENVHPFKFGGGWLVHNGVFTGLTISDTTRSDTFAFVDTHLQPLWEKTKNDFKNQSADLVDKYFLSQRSKGIIVENNGNVIILNEKGGHWDGARWFSNYGYVVQKTYNRGVYQTNAFQKDKGTKILCKEKGCMSEGEVHLSFTGKGLATHNGRYCLNCAMQILAEIEIANEAAYSLIT